MRTKIKDGGCGQTRSGVAGVGRGRLGFGRRALQPSISARWAGRDPCGQPALLFANTQSAQRDGCAPPAAAASALDEKAPAAGVGMRRVHAASEKSVTSCTAHAAATGPAATARQ